MKLARKYVEKPWGQTGLPPEFGAPRDKRIGEVWFEGAGDQPLLIKYLFTSERLSIQVHPDDRQAQARGFPRGKSECWFILDAKPNAMLGLGLIRETSRDELRASALDGTIEELIDWRPVRAGDAFMVPSGMIHAIGGGITLVEVQQNSNVTFRLYDYGRPRELHLDDGVSVASRERYSDSFATHASAGDERTLAESDRFVLIHALSDRLGDRRRWIIPIEGEIRTGSERARPGECLLLEPGESFEGTARLLIAAGA